MSLSESREDKVLFLYVASSILLEFCYFDCVGVQSMDFYGYIPWGRETHVRKGFCTIIANAYNMRGTAW